MLNIKKHYKAVLDSLKGVEYSVGPLKWHVICYYCDSITLHFCCLWIL